jgi:hypothetical protein
MKTLSAENAILQFAIKYLLPVLVIGIISRTFNILSWFYLIVPFLLIVNILLYLFYIQRQHKDLFYLMIIMMFPVYCLVTAFWSLSPGISIQRALYLILMYAGIFSSILILRYTNRNNTLIDFLLPANILIIVLSLVSLIIGIPDNRWTGGNGLGFMGFAGHQNTLAAAVLFTFPGAFTLVISDQRIVNSKVSLNRIFFWLLFTHNCFLITLTYSRAAILSLLIGAVAFLFFTRSKKMLSILFLLFAVTLILYFSIPVVQNSLDNVLTKDAGQLLDRRTVLWKPSLEAAKLGGLFGLGYGVSAPDIKTPPKTGSHYEDGRYIREKGNSVLALIEETGFFGLFLFLLPIFYFVITIFRSHNSLITDHRSLITAALAALLLHAQFEAWWVGVGSISLPLFLIILFFALTSNDIFNNNIENN